MFFSIVLSVLTLMMGVIVIVVMIVAVASSVTVPDMGLVFFSRQLQKKACDDTVDGQDNQVTDEDQHVSQWERFLDPFFSRPALVLLSAFRNNVK